MNSLARSFGDACVYLGQAVLQGQGAKEAGSAKGPLCIVGVMPSVFMCAFVCRSWAWKCSSGQPLLTRPGGGRKWRFKIGGW